MCSPPDCTFQKQKIKVTSEKHQAGRRHVKGKRIRVSVKEGHYVETTPLTERVQLCQT